MKNNYGRLKIVALIILILGLYAITAQAAKAGTIKIVQASQQEVKGYSGLQLSIQTWMSGWNGYSKFSLYYIAGKGTCSGLRSS